MARISAIEMFNALGYIFREPSCGINKDEFFYYENTVEDKLVCFYLKKKEVHTSQYYEPMKVDMQTFKAIQKQLEELGWLE